MTAPLTRETVTPASRRTLPSYVVGSAACGAALLLTLWRDHGDSSRWPPALLFCADHLMPLWLIGVIFLAVAAALTVALLQADRWAVLLALGFLIFWLLLLAVFFAVAAATDSATLLAPVPFAWIAYLCWVSARSVGSEETVREQPHR